MSLKLQVHLMKRDAGYMFWTFTEQAATMALPRLILFPLAAYLIGKEQFGVFITALSVTFILGAQPQNGLSTGLLRHFSDYPEEEVDRFCETAVRMCHRIMVIIITLCLLCVTVVGAARVAPWRLLNCIIPLTISLYPENQFPLVLTEERFKRRFQRRALWTTLRSVSIVTFGFLGALGGSAVGLAWGYMAGNLILYIILRLRRRFCFQNVYNPAMASVLKTVWLQITVAGIMAISGPYLNRLFLSFFRSYEDVADLTAATSVTFIFLAPLACSSGLLLSVISRYSSVKQFSFRGRVLWLLMLLFGVGGLSTATRLFGPFIMQVMFPKFGPNPVKLLHILVWLIVSESVGSLMRPFVVKFASVRVIPVINGIGLAAIVGAAVCLIPGYGAAGAAWAIVVGSAIIGIALSIFTLMIFLGRALAGEGGFEQITGATV